MRHQTRFLWLVRGQTLVEIVVVVGVVVLLVTGLVAGATAALKSSQYGRAKSLSVKYVQEGVELARSIRDRSWDEFFSYNGKTWCVDQSAVWSDGTSGCTANIGTYFTRTVTLAWNDPNMQVDVSVSWIDGSRTLRSDVRTYLTKWQ